MNSHRLCLAIVAAALLSTCASVDQQAASSDAQQEKVYATGSRIPVRDRSGSADVKSIDNQGATEMLQKRDVTISPKGN